MANMRMATILASESTTTAATKTIDLNIQNPISQIMIRFKGTNNGSTPTAHPAKMVSKIELVDGSEVLYSASGIESQAMSFYQQGFLPFGILEYEDNVQADANFNLNFGRYIGDEQLALDPRRFKNLQLKITHNKASGGSAPDAGTMFIAAKVFADKVPSPIGMLCVKEHYAYSLTSSGWEYIDLPTDRIIRRMMIQSLYDSKQPSDQYNKVKLSENNGQQVVIPETSTSELLKMYDGHRIVMEGIAGLGTGSAVEYFCTPTYECYYTGVGRSASQTTLIVSQGTGGTVDITNDSSESFQTLTYGIAPHGAWAYDFGCPDMIETWYNPQGLTSLRLELKGGSSVGSSSTCEVVLETLYKY